MFDVGFSELLLTALVALLVIGPERLPKVARTIGLWTGRARRFVNQVKEDIDREMKAEELKRIVQEQAKNAGIHEIVEETRNTIDEVKRTDQQVKADIHQATSPAPSVENNPATTGSPDPNDKQPNS
ncbi:MAG TPA: Sec-independent protein translocase protein TatB [Gammaproteobacteria bacterium]